MTDHSELKELLEYVVDFQKNLKTPPDVEKFCRLTELTKPAAMLALIADIDRLSIREDVLENLCDARFRINLDLETERDKLKAENEALRIALKDIRENSTDISACECAADALVDSLNSKGDKQ